MGIDFSKKLYFSKKTYFTEDEISTHIFKDDCWVTVGNKVYDITNILNTHIGASSVLLYNAGKDVYNSYRFHKRKKWKKYLIGYKK